MDIGIPELLVVLVIVLIIFGPSRITDIMGALGKGIAEFRKGSSSPSDDQNKNETPKPS
jgi:sec-independent protein translocase protein TatA